jgi:hypothetical protein
MDPGGPKTYGSGSDSRSATLVQKFSVPLLHSKSIIIGKKPYLRVQFLAHFLPFLWGRLLATTTVTVPMAAVAVTVSSMAVTVTGMIVGMTVTSMMIMCMTVTHHSFDVLLHDLVLRHVGLLGPLEGGRLFMAVTMVVMRMIVSMHHQLARQQHSQK